MSLSEDRLNSLWNELKALGPVFIIDKAHDFGGDRTGKLEEPPQIPLKGERAKKSFLAGFCKQLCRAFLPRTSNGRIIQDPDKWTKQVWADQKTVYYTVKVYTLLWDSVKMHSIDPFFQNGDEKNLYLQSFSKFKGIKIPGTKKSLRRPACKKPSQAKLFKNDFFKNESASKDMRDMAARSSTGGWLGGVRHPCPGNQFDADIDGKIRDGREITFRVGTSADVGAEGKTGSFITGKLARGRKDDSFLGGDYIVVSDSPISNQKKFVKRLVVNNRLKSGTSAFLDAAPQLDGEEKIFNINYDMPFLAAKNNDNTRYYINLNVQNNDGTGRLNDWTTAYYVLTFTLYSYATDQWQQVGQRVLNIKGEDNGIYPGDVGFLGCVINTLVNKKAGGSTAQTYQWDNINTIINSLTNPVSVIQRLIVKEKVMAALVFVAQEFATSIYGDTRTAISPKVKFVMAFIMQTKTMGDFSSLKDCEWMEQNMEENPPCFVSTTDIFLRKLVAAFYTPNLEPSAQDDNYVPKAFGGRSLNNKGRIKNPGAFSREYDLPQVGGVNKAALETALDQTVGGFCRYVQGMFVCDEEYGEVTQDGMRAAEEALEMDNIWQNIIDFSADGNLPDFTIDPYAIINDDTLLESRWLDQGLPQNLDRHLQMFGSYLFPTPLWRTGARRLRLRDVNNSATTNIWNISRQETTKEYVNRGSPDLRTQFYVSLEEALPDYFVTDAERKEGEGVNELKEQMGLIYEDEMGNDVINNKYLSDCIDQMNNNRSLQNFNNSINYLFIRAWQWRLNAIRKCQDYDDEGKYDFSGFGASRDRAIEPDPVDAQLYERCMFDGFNPERWFNYYFDSTQVQGLRFDQIRDATQGGDSTGTANSSSSSSRRRRSRSRVRQRRTARSSSRSPSVTRGGGKSKKRRRKRKKTRRKNKKKRRKKTKRRRKRRKKTRRRY